MNAAIMLNAETVDLLLRYGADLKLKDPDGDTALHLACQGLTGQNPDDELKVIRTLLAHEADPTISNKKGDWPLNLVDQAGRQLGKEQSAAMVLLATGAADPKIRVQAKGDTLWYAVKGNRASLVEALLDAQVDANAKSSDGELPLVTAARQIARDSPEKAHDVAMTLLKHGADPDRPGATGASARKVEQAFLATYQYGQRHQLYASLVQAMDQRAASAAAR